LIKQSEKKKHAGRSENQIIYIFGLMIEL
jgi:hypothetical protein